MRSPWPSRTSRWCRSSSREATTLYTLGSYLDGTGKPLGVFSGRKLLQTPRLVGTCRVGEAVWVQEVVDAGLRSWRLSTSAGSHRSSSSATRATAATG